MLMVSFWGGSEALHSLKGRQYSIMCQNRIRGLLKPQPVRGRCFILPTLQIFSWCLCLAALIFAVFVQECVCVSASVWFLVVSV